MRLPLLLISLALAAPAHARPGENQRDIGGNGPQRPRPPEPTYEEALAAFRAAYEASRNLEPGVPYTDLMERAMELRAAIGRLPPTQDPEALRQREMLDAMAGNVATVGALGDPMVLDVAGTLLEQGAFVQRNDPALNPPTPTAGQAPQTTPPGGVTPNGAAPEAPHPPPGPSPGDRWAATPAGAEAMARSGQDARRRGADFGKAGALGGKLAKTIGGAFDTKAPAGGIGGPGGGAMGGNFRGGFGERPAGGGAIAPARDGFASAPPGPGVPADPAKAQDLALAAASGFKASFDALGLKPGTGRGGASVVLRKDGTPATPEEVAQLRRRIAEDPKALLQRPDFYSVFGRDEYMDLKSMLAQDPGQPDFKDVALTQPEPRDVVWSASCDEVSGDCNPHAAEGSYKKDDYVAPETLSSIWRSIGAPARAAQRKAWEKHDEAAAAGPRAMRPLAVVGAMGGILFLCAAAGLLLRRDPAA